MAKELNKKTSELLITIKASTDVWKNEQEKAFNNLKKNLQIDGFRKGQVPDQVARQRISSSDIFSKAISKALDELVKEAAKEIDEDTLILDSPTYKIEKLTEAVLEVTFIYPVYPEINLGDYKKHGIEYIKPTLDEKSVDSEIQKILDSQTLLVSKGEKSTVVSGDTIKFDFEGFLDGVPFEGGAAKNYELQVGSGQFIPGFEDQVIGVKNKEERDVNVTFPESYHATNLAGKPVVFKIKIHDILTKETPTFDDEFVKSSGVPNVKTTKELEAYIADILTQNLELNSREAFQKEVFSKFRKEVEIPVPQTLVAKEMQNLTKQFEQRLVQQKLDLNKYIELTGQTRESIYSQHRQEAENRLKDSLIFAEIAKIENIIPTEDDYSIEYKKLVKVYNQSEDAIKASITKEQLQIPITNEKVISVLIGQAAKSEKAETKKKEESSSSKKTTEASANKKTTASSQKASSKK